MLAAALLLLATAGPRADLAEVLAAPRFLFKFLVTLSLAIPALVLLPRIATPLPRLGWWLHALWLAPLVLVAGVLLELAALPDASWLPSAVGHNALWCLAMVPILAAVPLGASLYCLRQAAPADPARAGAVAGLACGALARDGLRPALHRRQPAVRRALVHAGRALRQRRRRVAGRTPGTLVTLQPM